jgi:hypothetical protein
MIRGKRKNRSIIKKNAPIIGKGRSGNGRKGYDLFVTSRQKKVRNCLLDAQRLSFNGAGRP